MSEHDIHNTLCGRLSPEEVSAVLVQCADVTILLDDQRRVDQVFTAFDFDASALENWTGQPFETCVARDSHNKLVHLFSDNGVSPGQEGRWRHLNLIVNGKPDLPLLLKYFVFEGENGTTCLICGRDLRPLMGIQERFQREVDLIGHEKSRLEQKLRFLQ